MESLLHSCPQNVIIGLPINSHPTAIKRFSEDAEKLNVPDVLLKELEEYSLRNRVDAGLSGDTRVFGDYSQGLYTSRKREYLPIRIKSAW
jgi:hypothetical protein